ncbi:MULTISPECIES: hypothetical protein [unclassified Wolbachia]|uniref:hypothetical protein n=1 Tax=unclassified Wolbachia TaxID=2640676 RepID=UPI00209E9E4D|nr:hypothetical protein [Wolbachia endosymbiont of Psylliodes chrysocephala]
MLKIYSFQIIPLLPRCFFSVISVFLFLSSQCVTLGSRYKNICKLCNGQQILEAYVKLISIIKIRWIPVSRTGMTS